MAAVKPETTVPANWIKPKRQWQSIQRRQNEYTSQQISFLCLFHPQIERGELYTWYAKCPWEFDFEGPEFESPDLAAEKFFGEMQRTHNRWLLTTENPLLQPPIFPTLPDLQTVQDFMNRLPELLGAQKGQHLTTWCEPDLHISLIAMMMRIAADQRRLDIFGYFCELAREANYLQDWLIWRLDDIVPGWLDVLGLSFPLILRLGKDGSSGAQLEDGPYHFTGAARERYLDDEFVYSATKKLLFERVLAVSLCKDTLSLLVYRHWNYGFITALENSNLAVVRAYLDTEGWEQIIHGDGDSGFSRLYKIGEPEDDYCGMIPDDYLPEFEEAQDRYGLDYASARDIILSTSSLAFVLLGFLEYKSNNQAVPIVRTNCEGEFSSAANIIELILDKISSLPQRERPQPDRIELNYWLNRLKTHFEETSFPRGFFTKLLPVLVLRLGLDPNIRSIGDTGSLLDHAVALFLPLKTSDPLSAPHHPSVLKVLTILITSKLKTLKKTSDLKSLIRATRLASNRLLSHAAPSSPASQRLASTLNRANAHIWAYLDKLNRRGLDRMYTAGTKWDALYLRSPASRRGLGSRTRGRERRGSGRRGRERRRRHYTGVQRERVYVRRSRRRR